MRKELSMKPLEGRVALVAGATRGGGRGIARMLGEAGATVYCTGRSSRTQKSGGLFGSWALSDEYGFTDIDGARPHWGRYGKEHFPQFFDAKSATPYEWRLVESAGV
jgi:NAD(P)-dependent dehydrogenase (short-subunit alcohol dehydrogenase family)